MQKHGSKFFPAVHKSLLISYGKFTVKTCSQAQGYQTEVWKARKAREALLDKRKVLGEYRVNPTIHCAHYSLHFPPICHRLPPPPPVVQYLMVLWYSVNKKRKKNRCTHQRGKAQSALPVADVGCSGWAMLFAKEVTRRPTKHWRWQLIPGTSSAHVADPISDGLTILKMI